MAVISKLPTKMKHLIIILIQYLISVSLCVGQCDDNDELAGVILNQCDQEYWTYKSSNSGYLVLFENRFKKNTLLSPRKITKKELKKPQDTDSIEFYIHSKINWCDSTYNEIKKRNDSILQILTKEYIEHQDSIGLNFKTSENQFKDTPVKYLKRSNFRNDSLFKSLVRLPDFRINNCGYFIDSSFDFDVYYIVQYDVREEIYRFIIDLVRLDDYIENSLDLRENY